MKAIWAPKYTDEEKEWADKLQEPFREKYAELNWVLNEGIYLTDEDSLASQDDGDCSWLVPYNRFETATNALGIPYHVWEATACMNTTIAHKAMLFASKILAASAMDLITSAETLREAREEFEEATKGFVYECFVPADVKPPDASFFKTEKAKIPE